MKKCTDQTGHSISVEKTPLKIVSIVPSQTELLHYLGLSDSIAGISKFCIHPEEIYRTKPRIGGTKKLDIKKIRSLKPDLIIANKEENEEQQVKQLMQEFPVWISDISCLKDALEMIKEVGKMTDTEEKANLLADKIQNDFSVFSKRKKRNATCLYLIWKKPYMCAGTDTFINDMLNYCGLKNIVNLARYPEISPQTIAQLQPEYILLSSEPYPFKEKHMEELSTICPNSKILLVDGEMFSWYGSRLLYASKYFEDLGKSWKVS